MMTSETPSAGTLLRQACEKYWDRPLVTLDGMTWTYGEAWKCGGRLARALTEEGLERGDRAALLMSNRPEYVVGVLASVQGGFVNVPLSDMLRPAEYEYILSDSGARAVVTSPNFTDVVAGIRSDLPDLETVLAIPDDPPGDKLSIGGMLDEYRPIDPVVTFGSEAPFRLTYTGGTTGKPKGAYQTQGAAAMMMLALAIEIAARPYEEMLLTTPLAHAAGYYQLSAMTRGAHFRLTRGFDAGGFLGIVNDYDVTWTFVVPTILYRILDHELLSESDVSSIDTIVYGAAPVSPKRLSEAIDVFGDIFIQLYGQTETAALATSLQKSDHRDDVERFDSVGTPAILTEVRIADPADETSIDPRSPGEAGEILVRAPYTFDRYHGRAEETEATIVDGWVRTGDIGRFDESGYLHLLDRKDDVIITGGMNVYCNEVEGVLGGIPAVKQVAIVGIPDDDWGTAVHAVVVVDGADLSPSDVEAFADENLADYKKPKSVEFVERIPTTAHGKFDKDAIRNRYERARNVESS